MLTDPGNYMIDLVLAADDADPTFWRLKFCYDQNDGELPHSIRNLELARLQAPG
jgi:hypothetical protein